MGGKRAGLCTIACNETPLIDVIRLAGDAGASAIEVWGKPPHTSYPIDRATIDEARKVAAVGGVDIAVLGSYYQPGKAAEADGVQINIDNQIDLATALGVEFIRIWPGSVNFDETTVTDRIKVYDEIRRFADTAGQLDIQVVLERHVGTLTHGWDAPDQVLEELDHPNIALNYQIPYPCSVEEYKTKSVADYTRLFSVSKHAHLQNYVATEDGTLVRTQLADGIIDYSRLGAAAEASGYDGYLMIEFTAVARGNLSVAESIAADIAYINSMFNE